MKAETEQVLAGLKTHAVGQSCAIRPKELANIIGLRNKIVSNALNWLVVDKIHPNVYRALEGNGARYRYWWEDDH